MATGAPLTVSVTLRISIVSGAGADPQIFMIVTEKPCEFRELAPGPEAQAGDRE
jgi:hypothetical protein